MEIDRDEQALEIEGLRDAPRNASARANDIMLAGQSRNHLSCQCAMLASLVASGGGFRRAPIYFADSGLARRRFTRSAHLSRMVELLGLLSAIKSRQGFHRDSRETRMRCVDRRRSRRAQQNSRTNELLKYNLQRLVVWLLKPGHGPSHLQFLGFTGIGSGGPLLISPCG
jgi:hypothetical protein